MVLTGSQRPLGEVRTDARLNLIDAVTSALRGPPEVTVCFDSKLYRGNRTLKAAVADYDAFESPNFPLLGTLGVTARFEKGLAPRRLRLVDRLDPRVFLLKVFPGLDPGLPLALLAADAGAGGRGLWGGERAGGRRGGTLAPAAVPGGAAPRGAGGGGEPGARGTAVDLSLYEGGSAALAEGAIGGGDMTSVAAVVKLMHVLGVHRSMTAIRRVMERAVVGERS